MPEIEKEIIIKNPQGLHARPAASVVQIATRSNSEVTIKKDGEEIDGKSIMGILTLGAQRDSTVMVRVKGEDAEQVLNELEDLLTKEDE